MPERDRSQITELLNEWSGGNDVALDELMPLVYDELRRMAKRYMSSQGNGLTFQTTELIHEAYVKLAKSDKQSWNNRAHFFGVAATAMRHILVNHAVAKQSQKRGGELQKVTLNDNSIVSAGRTAEIVALNDALNELTALDERSSRVVEMKFFGGMTNEETAEVLKVSPETVKRDWQFARSWLLREVAGA